jgi:hypothetical protein
MNQDEIKQLEQDILAYAHLCSRQGELKAEKARSYTAWQDENEALLQEYGEVNSLVSAREADLRARIAEANAQGARFSAKEHGLEVVRETVIEITDHHAAIRFLVENHLYEFVKVDPETGDVDFEADGKTPKVVRLVTLSDPRGVIARIRPFALSGAIPWARPVYNQPLVKFRSDLLKYWQKEPAITVVEPDGDEPLGTVAGEVAKQSRRKATFAGADDDPAAVEGDLDDLS